MVNIMKMRLPLSEEYSHLARLVGESDAWMNWSGVFSWCQDKNPGRSAFRATRGCTALREARGSVTCRERTLMPGDVRSESVGFRPSFKAETDIPDGQVCVVGTLFMNGEPVRIPVCSKFAASYVPGAALELRPALEDENFQVRAIRAGGVLIADRVLLKNISWNDIQEALATPVRRVEIKSVRLPSSEEWDRMIDAALGVNSVVHWKGTFSWCLDECADNHDRRVTRGCYAGRYADAYKSESRMVSVGFRPVFDIENPKSIPEGEMVTVGTLYMDGRPVPTNHNGDMKLPAYIPGARLELRESAEDPKYHVKAIRAGDVLIGDRVLLSQISWDDLAKLGFCGNKNLKGETIMKDTTIIYLGNADDAYTIACSKQNEKKVLNFLTKRYPKWTKEYEGKESSLWNKLLDTVDVMKDLLEDDNLELLSKGNVTAIRLRDEVYGDSVVLCSRENEERVKAFLLKRYPKWSGNCIGKTGLTPWNDVEDAVRDMKELLGDGNLEFQHSCRDIPIPTDPIKN